MIDNFNDEANCTHKLLLTEEQAPKFCKNFSNNLSANIKLWNTRLSKMIKSIRFPSRFFQSLLKTVLPLMKNVLKP